MADEQAKNPENWSKEISSLGLSVKQINKYKGRGLFANKKIFKGDIIFEEKPLVCAQFAWNELYKYTACNHCMKSLETAQAMARRLSANPDLALVHPECCELSRESDGSVYCPYCQVVYCSDSCRMEAWKTYHQRMCLGPAKDDPEHPLNKLLEVWRNMHYPPETSSIMLIARIIATVIQSERPQEAMEIFESFCHASVNLEDHIAHKLLGREFQDQLELLRVTTLEALYDKVLARWFTPQGFKSLFALIGTNGQGVGTSSLSVYVHNVEALELNEEEKNQIDQFLDQLYHDMDQESGQFLNCEGSALYRLQSCCNHSCSPCAEVTFPYNNSTLVMVATEDIEPGQEISICYLDDCERDRSRHSRQKHLRENYLFQCSCTKCEEQSQDPDETSEDEFADETDE